MGFLIFSNGSILWLNIKLVTNWPRPAISRVAFGTKRLKRFNCSFLIQLKSQNFSLRFITIAFSSYRDKPYITDGATTRTRDVGASENSIIENNIHYNLPLMSISQWDLTPDTWEYWHLTPLSPHSSAGDLNDSKQPPAVLMSSLCSYLQAAPPELSGRTSLAALLSPSSTTVLTSPPR